MRELFPLGPDQRVKSRKLVKVDLLPIPQILREQEAVACCFRCHDGEKLGTSVIEEITISPCQSVDCEPFMLQLAGS